MTVNVKEAFAFLNLPEDATPQEIKRAFRRLSHVYHSDKGGDDERQKWLNEAHEVALEYANSTKALTVKDMVTLSRLVDQAVVTANRRSDAVRLAEQTAIRHRVSPLEQARLAAAPVAITSGVVAGVLTQVEQLGVGVPITFGIFAALLASVTILLTSQISLADQKVRALAAELKVEDFLVNFLREIQLHIDSETFDRDSFREGLSRWLEVQGTSDSVVPSELTQMIRSLDLEDASRLVIATGVEVDVLSTSILDDGMNRVTYYSIRKA